MDEAERLIARLDEGRNTIRPLVEQLSASTEVYEGWTLKELLSHLAGWDDATIAGLIAHRDNETPPLMAIRGIDFYNDHSVTERGELPFDLIHAEWLATREQLKAVLRSLPPEKFGPTFVFPWGMSGTVEDIIEIMASHEIEHTHEIRLRLFGKSEV